MLVGSSAMSMNVNICKNNLNVGTGSNDDKPDFIISYLNWVKCRCPYGYIIKVKINNIGAEIEETTVKIKVKLDSEETMILMNYSEGVGISTVKAAHLEIDRFKRTHIVIAEVDPPYANYPNGDIIESKEDNNIMTESFTKNIKIQGLSLQNLLNLYQNIFPIFT